MNIYYIDLAKRWFDHLKSGEKIVEGRKASPSWKDIKEGDILIFRNGGESLRMMATKVNKYSSLEEYFVGETLEKTLPGVKTIKEGEDVYLEWWTKEEIEKYGVLGISVKMC